jgi:hypothetical protein
MVVILLSFTAASPATRWHGGHSKWLFSSPVRCLSPAVTLDWMRAHRCQVWHSAVKAVITGVSITLDYFNMLVGEGML